MLQTFGHPVAICCNMLDDVVSNLKAVKFFVQCFCTHLAAFTQHCCTRACALGPLVARQAWGISTFTCCVENVENVACVWRARSTRKILDSNDQNQVADQRFSLK